MISVLYAVVLSSVSPSCWWHGETSYFLALSVDISKKV